MKKFLVFLVVLGKLVRGFPDGAPLSEKVCRYMSPRHEGPEGEYTASQLPFPYAISLNKDTVRAGDIVTVSIVPKTENPFKGFLLQGRRQDSYDMLEIAPAGTFIPPSQGEGIKSLNCFQTSYSTLTHSHNNPRSSLTVKWKAPDQPGKYIILVTIVQNFSSYWVREPSPSIIVS